MECDATFQLVLTPRSEYAAKSSRAVPARVAFGEAVRFWLKLGFVSFGGPAGQIALMHRELVERRRWVSDGQFFHALNYCMLLPGPEAQQLAVYNGWLLHRVPGGIVAGALFVLPSVFILLALSYVYAAFGSVTAVAGALAGCKPVIVALVAAAVVKIGKRSLSDPVHYALAAASFAGSYFLHVPFPVLVIAAAACGLALSWSNGGTTHDSARVASASAHEPPSRGRTWKILTLGAALWLVPLAAIVLWRGWDSLHAQQYRFFTQAALVTFGGAYALLAYVTQAAVGSYGWLTQAQAMDGLALAETTPGPLIMVLQFVGFIAAWNNPEGLPTVLSAVVGALVTTYATFLPSFLFIFLGAPHIERLRGNRRITGALSCVTAAVVGAVLHMALLFASAVFTPRGLGGGTQWFAVAVSGIAFLALTRFKIDVLWIVIGGGLLGALTAGTGT